MTNARSPLQDLFVEDRALPATAFAYVQCEVPAGMSLHEWRCTKNRARRAAEIEGCRERRRARVENLRRCIGRR